MLINGKHCAVQNGKVYGIFDKELECLGFVESCNRGELRIAREHEERLLTVEQIEAGEEYKPFDKLENFEFLGFDTTIPNLTDYAKRRKEGGSGAA